MIKKLGIWLLALACLSALAGTASAAFIAALNWATAARLGHGWLLPCLPVAGIAIVEAYRRWGRGSERGSNLVLEAIHEPEMQVRRRMSSLIFLSSTASHLFGASVGREGAAVQMGASIASGIARALDFADRERRSLMVAGIAAGFGSVFGAPWAGAIFAVEVLTAGRLDAQRLPLALAASWGAYAVCHAWGVTHTDYARLFLWHGGLGDQSPAFWLALAIASLCFGLAARFFAQAVHFIDIHFKRLNPDIHGRAFVGGLLILALVLVLGDDYLGLGIELQAGGQSSLLSAFYPGGALPLAWLWKLLFTAISIASGYKGGEVMPLFFIGACLGNALAGASSMPVDLFAALGMIALLSGAAKTPLACTVLGLELFGPGIAPLALAACYIAYRASGKPGIYAAQRR